MVRCTQRHRGGRVTGSGTCSRDEHRSSITWYAAEPVPKMKSLGKLCLLNLACVPSQARAATRSTADRSRFAAIPVQAPIPKASAGTDGWLRPRPRPGPGFAAALSVPAAMPLPFIDATSWRSLCSQTISCYIYLATVRTHRHYLS